MIDNTDKNVLAAVAGVHHLRQINGMRAEWMAEYGIKSEVESTLDEEEVCELEEEIRVRVRQNPAEQECFTAPDKLTRKP
ncbi:MAG: hypothetical protein SGJ27_15340 [Candidatus Melainabacteria bacterium]|nr:hypothetical protein [Candidatus Melainabacteria bacterium]